MPLPVDFIQLGSITSTNTWAKDHLAQLNLAHLTCITATEQTHGRGRMKRTWTSPPGGLYVTLCFSIPPGAPYCANLGQLLTLACAETLLTFNLPIQIKWPNDLLIEDKKIGGVLAETTAFATQTVAIIGLGLNVNLPKETLHSIGQPATSLCLLLHTALDPLSLLEPLLAHFFRLYETLHTSGFSALQPRFQELLAYHGMPITVDLPQRRVHGICDSITSIGCLKIRLPNGTFETLSIGDVLS